MNKKLIILLCGLIGLTKLSAYTPTFYFTSGKMARVAGGTARVVGKNPLVNAQRGLGKESLAALAAATPTPLNVVSNLAAAVATPVKALSKFTPKWHFADGKIVNPFSQPWSYINGKMVYSAGKTARVIGKSSLFNLQGALRKESFTALAAPVNALAKTVQPWRYINGKMIRVAGQTARATDKIPLVMATTGLGKESLTALAAAAATPVKVVVQQSSASAWIPNFIYTGTKAFGSFMGTIASKLSSASSTVQEAVIATPMVGSAVVAGTVLSDSQGMAPEVAANIAETAVTEAARIATEAAATEAAKIAAVEAAKIAAEATKIAAETAAVEAARIAAEAAATEAARPWYTKTGQVISEYASSAKTSASKGINTVVSAAKNNPKTAIATAVVGTAAVGCLAYRLYNRSSISLNEQGRTNLRTALSEASTLPSSDVWTTVMPEQLVLDEHFTVEGTGLPKTAVKALNEFVTLDGSCKSLEYLLDHQNGRTSPETVAKYKATKPLRDAAENRLKALALPVVAVK